MLSADMSLLKPLVLLIALSILSGCELLPTQSSIAMERPLPVTELQGLNNWLTITHQVSNLTAEEAITELSKRGKPDSGQDLFYYAILNQQLNHREGWIQARDAFRKLTNDTSLDSNLRELARIMQTHNQALINWHSRHTHLQKELAESVLDRDLLQRKIEALTELEAAISHRKQQNIAPESLPENIDDSNPRD